VITATAHRAKSWLGTKIDRKGLAGEPTHCEQKSDSDDDKADYSLCLSIQSSIEETREANMKSLDEQMAKDMDDMLKDFDKQFGSDVIDAKGHIFMAGSKNPDDLDKRYQEVGSQPLSVRATKQDKDDRAGFADTQRKRWEQQAADERARGETEYANRSNATACEYVEKYHAAMDQAVPPGQACTK